jgi:alpha/beta superfamily hydrolase
MLIEEPPAPGDRYAIVCHPHPLYGGTMHNKVVSTVARTLQAAGIATCRFNFRGVGASAGVYDDGRGETEDAAAVLAYGQRRWPQRRPIIAGFSFGAYVALRLAGITQPQALITVAPAVGRFDFESLPRPICPWLIVQGSADDVVDPQAVVAFAAGLPASVRLTLLADVGHFFHGRLSELGATLAGFIEDSK